MTEVGDTTAAAVTRLVRGIGMLWLIVFTVLLPSVLTDAVPQDAGAQAGSGAPFFALLLVGAGAIWACLQAYGLLVQPIRHLVDHPHFPDIVTDAVWMTSGPALAVWVCIIGSFSVEATILQIGMGAAGVWLFTYFEDRANWIAAAIMQRISSTD